jgi:D-alanyl-D-alanine dipeptidase
VKFLLVGIGISALISTSALAADLPDGFVRLADIDPTIRQDTRYAGAANFLGRPAKGYDAPVCILTRKAANALSKVQKTLAPQKLTLVVFDCYRPDRAVKDFAAWVRQSKSKDPLWHPNVRRSDLIKQGYIANRSGHSRGSTVDLGIAPVSPSNTSTDPACGAQNAGTLDFGTGFDCLDPKSRTAYSPLSPDAVKNRKLLVDAMNAQGFRNYRNEWWHFTLVNEPFPKQRFDFVVE